MPVALPPFSVFPVYFEYKAASEGYQTFLPCGASFGFTTPSPGVPIIAPDGLVLLYGTQTNLMECHETPPLPDPPPPTWPPIIVDVADYVKTYTGMDPQTGACSFTESFPPTCPHDDDPEWESLLVQTDIVYSGTGFRESTEALKIRAFATGVGTYFPDWVENLGTLEVLSAFLQITPVEDLFNGRRIVTIQSFKWRIRHLPIPTCYLKVWMRRRTRLYILRPDPPAPNVPLAIMPGSDTYEDMPPYIWEGSGNPCFPDQSKIFTHPDNLIKSSEDGVIENHPTDVPSLITVQILKWSFIPDYEPPDDNPTGPDIGASISTANGFPAPS